MVDYFVVNGINYSIINNEKKTARVGLYEKVDSKKPNAVDRNFNLPVNIPPYVFYNQEKYEVSEIGAEAFRTCDQIEIVKLPYTIVCLRYAAFDSCVNITSFTFPYGSRLETIEKNGLSRIYKLTELSLPFTIKTLKNESLACLEGLKDLYYCSSEPVVEDVFRDSLFDLNDHNTPKSLNIHITSQYQYDTFGHRTGFQYINDLLSICQPVHFVCTQQMRPNIQYMAFIFLIYS